MKKTKTISEKLKKADPKIRDFVEGLIAENREFDKHNKQLHDKIVKLTVANNSLKNSNTALHKELQKHEVSLSGDELQRMMDRAMEELKEGVPDSAQALGVEPQDIEF